MNNNIEEKIYECLEVADPEVLNLGKQLLKYDDKIELLIPPDEYNKYLELHNKREEMTLKIQHLEHVIVYKKALKEGLLMGVDLEI